jgi:DNA polymerase-3 subunit gamma/tau
VQKSLYQPLFLKYRPQKLSDILGQDSVKETLVNAIDNEKIVHAYLLTGPRGSGKTSTARIIAKSLNCTNASDGKSPTVEPCGKCESCLSIANSSSVDVTEIDAASHGQVADARNLIERVNLASVAGKYRVYIIDEVHMLSNAAFNALLKVIEEPPKNVVFVLATTEFDKVPKTIASRCQQLRFKPITINDVLKRLDFVCQQEQINISEEALEAIARQSDGAMRDALSLLDQVGVFSTSEEKIEKNRVLDIIGSVATDDLEKLIEAILKRDLSQLLPLLESVINFGKEPLIICQELNDFVLELLSQKSFANEDFAPTLMQVIKDSQIEDYELVQISNSLAELEIKLKQTTQTKALLKAWLVKLAYREDIMVVKDLLLKIEDLKQNGFVKSPVVTTPENSKRVMAIPQAPARPSPTETVQVKKFANETNVQEDVPQKVTTVASEMLTENAMASDFLDFLSPGSKGMFISSKASLTSVQAPSATITIPSKFKFLKDKLEARQEEFIAAIAKEHQVQITNLIFEISDTVKEAVASVPKSEAVLTEPQTCATRSNDISEAMPLLTSRDKLDEVKESVINIFGGKEILGD